MNLRHTKSIFGLSILLLMQLNYVLAQPTINSDISLVVGDRGPVQAFTQGNNVFDAGPAGTNVSWDFANVTDLGDEIEWEAILPSQTSWSADFPMANLAFDFPQDSSSDTRYYKISADKVEFLGWVSVLDSDTFFYNFNADPTLEITFPMTYQDQVIDTAKGKATVNFGGTTVVMDRTIIRNIQADGYGSLTTPFETFNQVLRVRIEESVEDKTFGQTVGTQKNVRYFWYQPNEKYLLLQMDSLVVQNGGGSFPSFSMFYRSGQVVTSLQDRKLLEDIQLYPQPAQERLHINLTSHSGEKVHLQLYSLEGTLVQAASLIPDMQTAQVEVDLHLPNGMYVLQVRQGQVKRTKKVWISH